MPSISIDTFFACTLIVSVVVISTALAAGILATHISSIQQLNEDEYFKAISEYIVSNCGSPADWGTNENTVPDTLGLARNDSLYPVELDIDKVCRLNNENAFALTYSSILTAARLKNVALGISVAQLMDASVVLSSNHTTGDSTVYTFRIHVSIDGKPLATSLHYYAVAPSYLSDAFNATHDNGDCYIDVPLPNSSNGTASLIVFAKANHDARITAYRVYSFGHLSSEPLPNGTFLSLSPINHTLHASSNSTLTLERLYAFSHTYQFNLTSASNSTYTIPTLLDSSPVVLAVSGTNASTTFIEWTTYPQIPFETGADFQNSECHPFSYNVVIKNTLYRLTLRFGGLSQ